MVQLVQKFTPSQLALALFGVPRDERMKMEAALSEKQRFVLEEELRRLDQAVPPKEMLARIREQIARAKPMEEVPPPFAAKGSEFEQEDFKNAA
jgi:flagellar motor switch protein FliG